MTKTKRSTAAAACAVGAAVGLLGAATPAVATGSATATYTCNYVDPQTGNPTTINNVSTTWQHGASGNLTIRSNILSPQPLPPGSISTVVNGVTLSNAPALNAGDTVYIGPANVPGAVNPTNPLILHFVGPPAVDVTCTLTGSSGFPI